MQKKSLAEFNIIEIILERICELQDRPIEIIQSEELRGKKRLEKTKTEQNLIPWGQPWRHTLRTKSITAVTAVPKEERENGVEKYLTK